MARVAVLIDGSNFLSQLSACDLSYPALAPLLSWIAGDDELVYARFYSAPYVREPYKTRWQAFRAANRHIRELQFFQGYRNRTGTEKVIDVALAIDLIYGCAYDHFDRAAVIGGDGDHIYAFKVARSMGRELYVYLMPRQYHQDLVAARIAFTRLSVDDLTARGICEQGKQAGVPLAHRAPPGSPDVGMRLAGALAQIVRP